MKRAACGAAASLALLALACWSYEGAAALPEPFSSSRFYSAGRVGVLREEPPVDASSEEGVAALVSARAFRPSGAESSELILFQFEASALRPGRHRAYSAPWLEVGLSLAWQLSQAGFHHFVALTSHPEDCRAWHAAWRAALPASPPSACAFAPPPGGSVEALWVVRWALAARLVALGGVNVLLLDADTALHRDPYTELHAPCLAAAQLVALQERGWETNGGWAYVRDAAAGGPVHWLLSQPARRYALFAAAAAAHGDAMPGRLTDQIALQCALRVAASANGSAFDFAGGGLWQAEFADHPLWRTYPQGAMPDANNPLAPLRPSFIDCPSNRAGVEPLVELRVPTDAGDGWRAGGLPELLAWAPASVASLAMGVHSGSWSPTPTEAITHMLESRGTWKGKAEAARDDVSHSARVGLLAIHGLWLPALSEARAGGGARLLALSPRLVELAAWRDSPRRLRNLIARLLIAAAISNRTAVLPQLPCDAPWLERDDEGGVLDARVFVARPADREPERCYVGAASGSSCWPWLDFAFAFDPLAELRLRSAQQALWDLQAAFTRPEDLELTHLPFLGKAAEAAPAAGHGTMQLERLRIDCESFLEETEAA